MEIWRSGARRFTLWSTLVSEEDTYYEQSAEWFSAHESVVLNKSDVSKPESNERQHHYRVLLNLGDIAIIINTLAEQGLEKKSAEIAKALKPSAVSLLRLALCVQENASRAEDLETG